MPSDQHFPTAPNGPLLRNKGLPAIEPPEAPCHTATTAHAVLPVIPAAG